MLEGAEKHSYMVTTYRLPEDPPIFAQGSAGERLRLTRVIVETTDTGYVGLQVKGISVTKSGKDRANHDYFFADKETHDAIREELEKL